MEKKQDAGVKNTQKKRKEIAPYGNYKNYYGYRVGQDVEEDPRFKVLKTEWFEDKDCLDIGCNNGLITINIAKKFRCQSILGVDIDSNRIEDAYWNLRKFVKMESTSKMHSKASRLEAVERANGTEQVGTSPLNEEIRGITRDCSPSDGRDLFKIVSFRQEDFVKSWHPPREKHYDTIICFSVTKWIHLNWGDDGLITLFAKIWRLLHQGGILVLEPQPWNSYEKNRRVSETATANYCNIMFYPERFQEILLDKIGFRTVENVTPSLSGKKAGFNRPVLVFRK
ncbi:probable RNA methyltransferase At5g51130 isoform X2 [Malania oleifera]|nr:probable RNA methyltransferase At5g51130 isoform X2 [Malania oleifera]XP_057966943.1 probable RNA methyltransferase At5g51130 isoform X2 [Malania oleifera]XP_057966944.1 probable RNA methyltransferase At5g51130 isoform X2 [Malania oleifera]